MLRLEQQRDRQVSQWNDLHPRLSRFSLSHSSEGPREGPSLTSFGNLHYFVKTAKASLATHRHLTTLNKLRPDLFLRLDQRVPLALAVFGVA